MMIYTWAAFLWDEFASPLFNCRQAVNWHAETYVTYEFGVYGCTKGAENETLKA